MFFRVSVHFTSYLSLRMREMNSSRLPAYLMQLSMVFIRRNFQLSPLTADRYSLALIPWRFF